MRETVLVFVCTLMCVAAATAQTAKDYYKELHDANGLNPLMMFACFPEQDTGYFDTIALTRTFQKTAEEKHLKPWNGPKSDMLFVAGFYKGIARDPILLDNETRQGDSNWVYVFKGIEGHPNAKGRFTFRINWQTLRYEREVKIDAVTKQVAGRCELIQ
jgi:hypothetical protein